MSGESLNSRLLTIAFRETLFPVPVAPATSRWGILAKSVTKGAPVISLPSAMVSLKVEFLYAWLARTSFR